MRLITVIASVLTFTASVSAQTSDSKDSGSSELLAELAQLPNCAVSDTIFKSLLLVSKEPIVLTFLSRRLA